MRSSSRSDCEERLILIECTQAVFMYHHRNFLGESCRNYYA